MSGVVEQVREGLEAKIRGIQGALNFIQDEREHERLINDMKGAEAALAKLSEKDTRTAEELENIARMISDEVEISGPVKKWSELSPLDKFKYQLELYSDKVKDTHAAAVKQQNELSKVCLYLKNIDFEKFPFMRSVHEQFDRLLAEVNYSCGVLAAQLKLQQNAFEIVDGDMFGVLDILNRFMNNPMNLPHLAEERESCLEGLKNGKKD